MRISVTFGLYLFIYLLSLDTHGCYDTNKLGITLEL